MMIHHYQPNQERTHDAGPTEPKSHQVDYAGAMHPNQLSGESQSTHFGKS